MPNLMLTYRFLADSPVRLINGVDPVIDTTNAYLACGQGAENRAMADPANPGSEVAFN